MSHWIRTTVLLLVGYCHHPTHSYTPSFIRLHVHRSSSLLSPLLIPSHLCADATYSLSGPITVTYKPDQPTAMESSKTYHAHTKGVMKIDQ